MEQKINYQKKLEELLNQPQTKGKTLLLHSCCAPCSSYVMEYLRSYFKITVFYYNPNITEDAEYRYRLQEQKRLIAAYNTQDDVGKTAFPIAICDAEYETSRFFEAVKGLEHCKEGSERCFACFALRLERTAREALQLQSDYFGTTLTISPLKNAAKINEIGENLEKQVGISFLPSDFKKKNGYKRSIELSKEYDLYRQDYCGCIFSRVERDGRKAEMEGTSCGKECRVVR